MSTGTSVVSDGVQGVGPRRVPGWRSSLSTHSRLLVPALVVVALVVVWQLAVALAGVPEYLLPAPFDILDEMVSNAGLYAHAAVPTLQAIGLGFALAFAVSLPLAAAMTYSRILRLCLNPLVVIAQVTPKVAVAPLFIIWFGFGQMPKVLMVALISFFPLLINSRVGFAAARPQSLMLVRSMGATKWQAFRKIRWPWALPSIFAGAKVAVTLAVIGAVVAEFVGSNEGLGVLLIEARGNLDSITAFAAIGWLTILGSALYLLVEGLERLVVPQAKHARGLEGAGGL